VATDARLGSFDDLMSELPPGTAATVEPIARKLREIVPFLKLSGAARLNGG